jgi:dTDP-4-amino-4,6-dideoxygalactose transaminase
MIPHSRPSTGEEEALAAASVVRSGCLSGGPITEQFERETAERTGAVWGVATGSGASALHLALLCLNIRPGDRIAIPSYVCVALLHVARYLQAEPVIVDVDPATMNMDPDALKRVAPARLKAVVVPHMFGRPAEMDALMAQGAPIVEDCAHAIGADIHGKPVGGQGALSICSFYATKMITTGEGGMVTGHDAQSESMARDLRDYDRPDAGRVRYNYKMTEMQAAIGLAQLKRLPSFIARRRQIALLYHKAFKPLNADIPNDMDGGTHIYYRYALRVSQPTQELIERMEKKGVACRRPVACPIHRLLGLSGYPGADAAFDRALSVPIYPTLTDDECARVVSVVTETLYETN